MVAPNGQHCKRDHREKESNKNQNSNVSNPYGKPAYRGWKGEDRHEQRNLGETPT